MSNFSPPNRLLFGPGPSQVAPRVYQAMTKSIVGHLDPYFFQINEEIRAGLQVAYGTANAFTMAISGTGSLVQRGPGTTVLAANNTYGGTTTISAGTLQVGNGGTSGTLGTGAVIDNGVLAINRSGTGMYLSISSTSASGSASMTRRSCFVRSWLRSNRAVSVLASMAWLPPPRKPARSRRWPTSPRSSR